MKVYVFLLVLCVFVIQFCDIRSAEWNTKDYMKREHSLIKPYQDGRWDFHGSTMVTNNYIRLTPDHQSRRGAIWNTVACELRDWELHVNFKVHGTGSDLFGDGFALWYTRDRMAMGPVFGNQDYFHGLAIFLDTYSNHNGPHNHGHPYISAMVNNGTLHYDHDRDGTHTEVDGCEAQFRNKDHDTHVAIRYELNTLTVSVDIDNQNNWKHCFKAEGVRLPIGYYFGASAGTGELADNHDIVSMKLYDIDVERKKDDNVDYRKIQPSADFFASPRDHTEDPSAPMSGWKLFSIVVVAFVGFGVCSMVGFILYIKRQEDSRKRFY